MTQKKIPLAHLPTKIESLPRLTKALGGPQIFCKRDDQTGLGFGGNKTRKLEYLLAEALNQEAKTLVSVGSIQSNHCRQTAALAARFGLECILVLSGTEPERVTGNLFLDRLFGAQIIWADRDNRDQVLEEVILKAKQEGKAPYKIPYGGSSRVGMLGYVDAMHELRLEEDKTGINFDWIVTASSSGGTQAGMVLGAQVWGFKGKILGIAIEGSADELKATVNRLVTDCAEAEGISISSSEERVLVDDRYNQLGYGVMGANEIQAIRLFASQEGLLLDPVYTGRAAAGMIDLVRKGFFKKEDKVLFWHTGGTPALFAEPYLSQLQFIPQ